MENLSLTIVIATVPERRGSADLLVSNLPKEIGVLTMVGGSLSNARNRGIDSAPAQSSDIIGFIDDDVQIFWPQGWAARILCDFREHPEICGLTGAIMPMMSKGCHKMPRSLDWVIGCVTDHETAFSTCTHGAQMFFRRDAIGNLRFNDGFSEGVNGKNRYVGDDHDFAYRVAARSHSKIMYDPKLAIGHLVTKARTQLRYIARYAYWQGRSEARFERLSNTKNEAQTKFRKEVWGDLKSLQFLKILMVTTAVFFGGIGYIWEKIRS